MNWIKKGLIFDIRRDGLEWMKSHAQIPVVFNLNSDMWRIYFSTRKSDNKSLPVYIDVNKYNFKVEKICEVPLLKIGDPGTFDDSGIVFSSFVEYKEKLYMYYIGWNQGVTVSYRLAIGLAISEDGGNTFYKYSEGPIMERCVDEPFFNTAPCVIKEDIWKMWYVSSTGYRNNDGVWEAVYCIRHAVSDDGISWIRDKEPCLDTFSDEALGRPWVINDGSIYRMWYSSRKCSDFRININNTYKIGYAESNNGKIWTRKDDEVGIFKSDLGWDSNMMCYTCVVKVNEHYIMFYNGNDFGKYAIGYAILETI